jgi:hypothetical protein
MSRYRKIEVRTWSDEGFRSLSPLQPSGQALWFYLLTGPQTGPIPGLYRAGRAAMAEELGWDLDDFADKFQELHERGMAQADWKARLVWLPNALKHNRPESPNVVLSWRTELDLLPECPLKREAVEKIRQFVAGMGPTFLEAFDRALSGSEAKPARKGAAKRTPEALRKASRKAWANQEQEQEQNQEQETHHRRRRPRPMPAARQARGVGVSALRCWPPPCNRSASTPILATRR